MSTSITFSQGLSENNAHSMWVNFLCTLNWWYFSKRCNFEGTFS